jgi:hypothetical protein
VVISDYLDAISSKPNDIVAGPNNLNASLRFDSFELLLNGNQSADMFRTGDHVTVRLKIAPLIPCNGFYVGIGLLNELDQLIFAFHSKEAGLFFKEDVREVILFELDIPTLNLMPGRYRIRLVLVDRNGHIQHEVPSACEFNMVQKDYSGHGYSYGRDHGIMLIPFEMKARYGTTKLSRRIGF